jgi:integrase
MARREWGSGSICRRTVTRNGNQYTYWRAIVPGGPLGRRREAQRRTERQARDWLRANLAHPLPAGSERVTVGAYAVDWLRDTSLTVKPNTVEFYRGSLRHLEQLATLPIAALTPAHVRDLMARKTEAGLSTRTVRGIVQTLALVLRRAEEDGLVDRNVAALVRLPKLETKPPEHFTAAQVRRFLDAAKDDPLGSLYAVALGTGLRRGELLGLQWRDVDGEAVVVRSSKTHAGIRVVPLPDFAREALAQTPKRPGPIWPYRPEYVTRHFKRLCEQAGVPVLTLHSTRHTAASLMLDAGVDPLVIQQILGHTRVAMTGHYARSGEELRRDAVERLAGQIAGQRRAANDR